MQYLSAPVGRMQLSDLAPRRTAEFRAGEQNDAKIDKFHSVVDALLRQILVPGFHGEGTVKAIVHDGRIELIEECRSRKRR